MTDKRRSKTLLPVLLQPAKVRGLQEKIQLNQIIIHDHVVSWPKRVLPLSGGQLQNLQQ